MTGFLPPSACITSKYVNIFEIESPAIYSAGIAAKFKDTFRTYGINSLDPIEVYIFTRSEQLLTNKKFGIITGLHQIMALKELIVDEPEIAWPRSIFVKIFDIPVDFYL